MIRNVAAMFVGLAILSWTFVLRAAPVLEPTPAPVIAAAPNGTLILSNSSYWRWHMTWRKAVVEAPAGDASAKPVLLKVEHADLETPAPPADWTSADFDDSGWPRAHAPFNMMHYQNAVFSLRGKFDVTDPSAVKALRLAINYYGGAVVYLNGKEIARHDLPDGPITADTPGNAYPNDAWVDSKGQPMPHPYTRQQRISAGEKDLQDRVALRDRKLSVDLPKEDLRNGVNIVCIETHRTIYNPAAQQWAKGERLENWVPNALIDVKLAVEGGGVTPNVARPAGVQLWNADVQEVIHPESWGDPNDPLRPIRLTGAKNGTFSGAVVVSSAQSLKGVSASAGELTGPGGAKIAAADVQVRYLRPGIRANVYSQPMFFDALLDRPDAEVVKQAGLSGNPPVFRQPSGNPAQIVPIWMTIHVPADAAAGDYRGTLTVKADGLQSTEVPVALHVADYTLPAPRDGRTYVGIYQSPTSESIMYGVPEWSDKHWALVEQSFKMLAQLGNRLINIPVVEETQFGNQEGMVRWLKQDDGSFKYDFSTMDRYVDLFVKTQGKPQFVALHIWHSGGWKSRALDQENTVTVVDKDGKHESLQIPPFATDASTKFWTPVLKEAQAHLAQRGLDKTICIGIISDADPPPALVTQMQQILPGVGWMRGAHTQAKGPLPQKLRGGGETVLWEQLYGIIEIADPTRKDPARIWNESNETMGFLRMDFDSYPPLVFRNQPERTLFGGTCGIGRECLDFWPVTEKDKYKNIYNRWTRSTCDQREPTVTYLAEPGPDGPVATARFEMLREGLQETEALMAVANASQGSGDLAKHCHDLVMEYYAAACQVHYHPEGGGEHYYGWQNRSADLFATAGHLAANK